MDYIPIEYRDRMMAEQMVMMEALQLLVQILICFAILITFVILIVNLSGIVWTRLRELRPSERRQLRLDQSFGEVKRPPMAKRI